MASQRMQDFGDDDLVHVFAPQEVDMLVVWDLCTRIQSSLTTTTTAGKEGLTPFTIVWSGSSVSIVPMSTRLSLSPYKRRIGVEMLRVGN